uniref:histone acetyltransferase n=1 Tax=Chlamydomonas leiostraca TaxID=1034604 RepID=A0A7S0S5Q8_9CHLO|mmetsp:Transcript_9230/g.22849  ORF Transcript_9230/g.22849 Transcript_9230/m.22849 type:complete len:362 (+) Transcript_9230:39-1124(+)
MYNSHTQPQLLPWQHLLLGAGMAGNQPGLPHMQCMPYPMHPAALAFHGNDQIQHGSVPAQPARPGARLQHSGGKVELAQRWLLFMRHCATCKASAAEGCEQGSRCRAGRALWSHMVNCQATGRCSYPKCDTVRSILKHHKTCSSHTCPVCVPVKRYVYRSNAARAQGQQGEGQPGQGQPPQPAQSSQAPHSQDMGSAAQAQHTMSFTQQALSVAHSGGASSGSAGSTRGQMMAVPGPPQGPVHPNPAQQRILSTPPGVCPWTMSPMDQGRADGNGHSVGNGMPSTSQLQLHSLQGQHAQPGKMAVHASSNGHMPPPQAMMAGQGGQSGAARPMVGNAERAVAAAAAAAAVAAAAASMRQAA